MTWTNTRLKFLAKVPIQNGVGEAGTEDNPNWPRYVRTTDIAGPRELRTDVFASLNPDIAAKAPLETGDLVMTAAGATIGKSMLYRDSTPACYAGYLVRFRAREDVDPRFIAYWTESSPYWHQIRAGRVVSTIENFSAGKYQNLRLSIPSLSLQRNIADYLDRETGRIDALVGAKKAIIERLYEKCDAEIREAIGRSGLVNAEGPTVELRRVLGKHKDVAPPATPLVTAYRDGQVTLRELRRAEGYTEAAENSGYLGVSVGDVVLHGLDGFAGAVGTAEASGACSPVYHVLRPSGDDDPYYWGRMLRVLAVTGYLALFVTSTRERAYDMRNWEVMGRIPVPVVPIHEQRRIGNVLRKIPPLRDVFSRSITLLKEHRQALITAAVTGQLEIPESP